ncbi:MAG: hypothetical protein DRJ33_07340 [Candidatus Methanomethylicota archaeon]|uniref:Cytochrome b561 bacterial/Ni-hydrogenase domain-containing protein n=1 Tax=Thermoproteota archaeon TaxID=2056631 RepID=A0A497EV78_9CREN|nr:MAG: hypothetical protein DRJ33_07340 [Candidatus Verstraetearchaeota archaeon]
MIHRICGFGIIVLAIVYAIWQVKDIKKWKIIRKGGSIEGLIKYYIAGEHANFDKYNPGQVLFFWVFIVPVVVVASITGLILVFKGAFDAYTVSLALLLHDCAFFWGLIGGIFHVVAGVVLPQNRPVVDAMFRTGMLPLSFIKEHHSLWYEELKKELGLKE